MEKVKFPIYVSRFGEAVDFFRSIEIFSVQEHHDWGTGRQADVDVLGVAGFALLLTEARNDAERSIVGKQAPGGMWLLDIPVDDIERVWESLTKSGVDISEIKEYPFAGVALMKDPFGNKYMLSENWLSHPT